METRFYIAGTTRKGGTRSISPVFNSAERAAEWLNQRYAEPVFKADWKGGSFELVEIITEYKRSKIIPAAQQ